MSLILKITFLSGLHFLTLVAVHPCLVVLQGTDCYYRAESILPHSTVGLTLKFTSTESNSFALGESLISNHRHICLHQNSGPSCTSV